MSEIQTLTEEGLLIIYLHTLQP